MNYPRQQGLEIELKYTGEDKQYDISHWTKLNVSNLSRKEMTEIVNHLINYIREYYQRDRVEDIELTRAHANIQPRLIPPIDLDDFLDNHLE